MVDEAELRRVLGADDRIAAAWLFGSLSRGVAGPASDLDIAILVISGQTLPPRDLLSLANQLERFSPSRTVDVVVLGSQGPVFRHRVLREGQLLVDRDPEQRIDFEARTHTEYFDWKPTHDIAMRSTWEGLARRLGETR